MISEMSEFKTLGISGYEVKGAYEVTTPYKPLFRLNAEIQMKNGAVCKELWHGAPAEAVIKIITNVSQHSLLVGIQP